MPEITIYRVQHKLTACGPYLDPSKRESNWLQLKHSGLEGSRHPEPFEDGLELLDDEQVCGMVSASTLESWFEGCGAWLKDKGFLVALHQSYGTGKYSPQVSQESGQVVFWPDPDGADDYLEIWWN